MADTLAFEIVSDIASILPQKIDTNFELVKSGLEDMMRPYASLVVTEDAIADAKKDLAKLRKLKDGINAQKVAVKKEWMAPYLAFEYQPKELMEIVDRAIGNLDGQIKAYDEERRAAKLAELQDVFARTASSHGVSEYVTWNGVFNPKWLNATFSIDAATGEMEAACAKAEEDLDFIRSTHSAYEAAMLDEYSRSLDLREALNTAKRLESIQKAEKDAKEPEKPEKADTPPDTENAPCAPLAPFEVASGPIPRSPEKFYTLIFELTMTARQAHALKEFMDAQEIRYRKL